MLLRTLFALLVFGSTTLYVRGQSIEEFHANVDLRKNGLVVVAERITLQGAPTLRRTLPLEYASGSYVWNVEINVLAVRDAAGDALGYQTFTHDRHLEITVPVTTPSDRPKTILLLYEVQHAVRTQAGADDYLTLRFIDDHNWRVPIERVVLTASVPGDPAGGLHAYTNGTADQQQVIVDGRRVRINAGPLSAGYWLDMTIHFPHGMIALPLWDRLHQEDARTLAGLLFVTACLGLLTWYVRRQARAGRRLRTHSLSVFHPAPVSEASRCSFARRCGICNAVLPEGTDGPCPTCIADRKIILTQPPQD